MRDSETHYVIGGLSSAKQYLFVLNSDTAFWDFLEHQCNWKNFCRYKAKLQIV
jgi:hypothetical protein